MLRSHTVNSSFLDGRRGKKVGTWLCLLSPTGSFEESHIFWGQRTQHSLHDRWTLCVALCPHLDFSRELATSECSKAAWRTEWRPFLLSVHFHPPSYQSMWIESNRHLLHIIQTSFVFLSQVVAWIKPSLFWGVKLGCMRPTLKATQSGRRAPIKGTHPGPKLRQLGPAGWGLSLRVCSAISCSSPFHRLGNKGREWKMILNGPKDGDLKGRLPAT